MYSETTIQQKIQRSIYKHVMCKSKIVKFTNSKTCPNILVCFLLAFRVVPKALWYLTFQLYNLVRLFWLLGSKALLDSFK